MIEKKTDRANLERRRGEMFLVAVLFVLSVMGVALQWDTTIDDTDRAEEIDDLFEDIDISDLKKDMDMVAAISEADEPAESNNIKPAEVMQQAPKDATTSKLLVGEGESEVKDAKVEEVQPQVMENDEDAPEGLHTIEELPEFPGGASAFMKWLTANIKYPRSAQQAKQKGRVVVSFIVTKTGDVTKLKLEKSDNRTLSTEVMRCMGKMPKWKPATKNGVPTDAMIAVPVNFEL